MLAQKLRAGNKQVSLVPTSGNLHEGHFQLVRAGKATSDVVVVSVIPAPTPLSVDDSRARPFLAQDVERLVPLDPDYVFAPQPTELVSGNFSTEVSVRGLDDRLYGSLRPGHYTQKSTFLVLLFNLTDPHYVHLGEKDIQEWVIARRVIQDLAYDIKVLTSSTLREEDGVAAGAELQWLNPGERKAASALYRGLERAQVLFGAGERDAASLIKAVREIIESEVLMRIDLLSIVNSDSLEITPVIDDQPVVLAGAVRIGDVRLIDSVWLNR